MEPNTIFKPGDEIVLVQGLTYAIRHASLEVVERFEKWLESRADEPLIVDSNDAT